MAPFLFAQTSNVVSVPKVFAPNTPIKASEVNENFKAISDAIRAIPAEPACPGRPTCGAGSGITSLSGFNTLSRRIRFVL